MVALLRPVIQDILYEQGKLIAGVSARVQVYKWSQKEDTTRELLQECSHTGHIMVLFLQTRGDFILVGGASFCRPWAGLGYPHNELMSQCLRLSRLITSSNQLMILVS